MASDKPWACMAGKWKVVRQENYDEYLTEREVGFLLRKVVANAKPSFDIVVDGDNFTATVKVGPKTIGPNTFVVNSGQETEAEFMDNKFKVKARWEDGQLKMDMVPVVEGKGKPQSVYREIVGDEMVMTLISGNVTCKRYLQKEN